MILVPCEGGARAELLPKRGECRLPLRGGRAGAVAGPLSSVRTLEQPPHVCRDARERERVRGRSHPNGRGTPSEGEPELRDGLLQRQVATPGVTSCEGVPPHEQ